MRHVISILLQNESGALARVASMFASRGFNIESLNVAPTADEAVSRLTLVTIGTEEVISQINKQLAKLIDVVAIADRTSVDHIERELALVKLRVPDEASDAVVTLAREAGARILDEDPGHLTLEITGKEAYLDRFLEELPETVEILSLVRSGPLVTARGPRSLS